jgi:predicted transglutaminase-like cysteine proteinase
LRFATLVTSNGEYHAVLFVDHADGRLVLDNLAAELRSWPSLEAEGHRLVAVEGEGVDGGWRLTPYGSVVALLAGHAPAATP